MNFVTWTELNGNDQVDMMERVLGRIEGIPGFNKAHNATFHHEYVGSNEEQIRIEMTSDDAGVDVANALALSEYLDANRMSYAVEMLNVIVFSMDDLFALFSDE